jgi:ABC-type oligopeptide transport system ATPase subunit
LLCRSIALILTPWLQFKDISLKYAPTLPPALNGVSFKLPHAAKVGVVGRTGSGKSTLLVALFRLIQPCDGAIVLNGRSILVRRMPAQLAAVQFRLCLFASFGAVAGLTCLQSADLDALRNQLSIVPQEPAMFAGTLRENIDPFVRYSDAEVAKVIEDCGLGGRSLDATVGVSGENFSLGEKQLVRFHPTFASHPQLPLHVSHTAVDVVMPTGLPGARASQAACSSCPRRGHFRPGPKNGSIVSEGFGGKVPSDHHPLHCAPSRDLALVQDAHRDGHRQAAVHQRLQPRVCGVGSLSCGLGLESRAHNLFAFAAYCKQHCIRFSTNRIVYF